MDGERWIKHYSNFHKILLVGEGDFSFSVCLAKAFGSATNMVATSLDNKAMVIVKHPTAKANLETLENQQCTICHEVDAHTMSTHPLLKTMKFDRIVFNFPHAGFQYPFCGEHNQFQIHLHQEVLRGFFRNGLNMLTIKGEIHVTHKMAHPFSKWELEKLGEEAGLFLIEKVKFTKFDYPGYDNKKGDGRESNKTFPVGECSTFKFALLTITDQMEGERWIKHYSNLHKILIVGEEDFSFSVCLAKAFGSATNMVATSLDNKEMVIAKHPTAKTNLDTLESLECTTHHKVDARTMSTHPLLKTMKFDRIVFNFPHAGFQCLTSGEHGQFPIRLLQEVERGFFSSACKMLSTKGEIHVTHKMALPFSKSGIEKLGEEGYGKKGNKSFCEGECSTFEFTLPNSHVCLHCLEEDQQMRRISQFMNQGRRSRRSRIRPKWILFSALDV